MADGFQVVAGSEVYLAGETLEVDRDQAERWRAAGWAVPADRPTSRLPSRGTAYGPAQGRLRLGGERRSRHPTAPVGPPVGSEGVTRAGPFFLRPADGACAASHAVILLTDC